MDEFYEKSEHLNGMEVLLMELQNIHGSIH